MKQTQKDLIIEGLMELRDILRWRLETRVSKLASRVNNADTTDNIVNMAEAVAATKNRLNDLEEAFEIAHAFETED